METKINLLNTHDLEGAVFIEGSPTAGAAGILAVNYLRETFNGVLVCEVLSPYFPQISIIDENGIASRPKLELYLVKVKGLKLLLAGRLFPAEGNEGSYEVASKLYEFLSMHKISEYIVLASGRLSGDGSVYVSTTNLDHSKKLLEVGAKQAPSFESLPVDRISAFLMLFFARDKRKVSLLFSDTILYMPDHLAAKKILEVVSRYLNFEIDFRKLDSEIERQNRMMQEFEHFSLMRKQLGGEERPPKEPFYIG